MNYTQEEKDLIEAFDKGYNDLHCECCIIYDFGMKRQGFTQNVKDYISCMGQVVENEMCFGINFNKARCR